MQFTSRILFAFFLGFFIVNTSVAQSGFSTENVISTLADGTHSVYAADLDGDGDLDALSANRLNHTITWYENDGTGSFSVQNIITSSAFWAVSVYAADIDGDGDLDVLSASFNDHKIAWYQNDGTGVFGPQNIITTLANEARCVYAADIDGDGDLDVLSASTGDNKIAWYQNNGSGTFGAQNVISTNANGAWSVYAEDMDGDGDMDVLSASNQDDKIAWYENNGTGTFGVQNVISTIANGAYSVKGVDIDGDGDMDVISASAQDNKIAWYENDGTTLFGPQNIISSIAAGAISVNAFDLDSDGDLDVVSASNQDNKIAWYQNDGSGSFGSEQVVSISAQSARSVYAGDLDGDGDLDLLSASYTDDKIAWYENNIGLSFTIVVNNEPCVNASNGSFLVNVGSYNAVNPYTYYWELNGGVASGSGMSTQDIFTISNLAAGTYDVTLVNALGDSAVQNGLVLNDIPGSVFEITAITVTNSGNAAANGSIFVEVDGGTTPYNFAWVGAQSGSMNSNMDSITIPNLVAGSYTISVTENGGAVSSYIVTILDETTPIPTCQSPLDVVILNDVSGSVNSVEYNESKQFFVDFCNALNIGTGANDSRAAILEWSGSSQQAIKIPMTGILADLQNYINLSRSYSNSTAPNNALTFGKNYLDPILRSNATGLLVLSTDGSQGQISSSLVALAQQYEAQGYIISTIAFDNAFTNSFTRNLLSQAASNNQLAPGAQSYSQLTQSLANSIVNSYICPSVPGSSASSFFNRDGVFNITDYSVNGFCPYPNSVDITFTVSAEQQLSVPSGMPVTFYYNNPTTAGATQILTWQVPCAIPAGSTETFTVTLPVNSSSNIFGVLNDDGAIQPPFNLPVTNIMESIFINNTDDTSICVDPLPTLSVTKYTTTPYPVCDSLVLYTVNVCNISGVNATGVSVTDIAPTGFVLNSITSNGNTCSSGSNPYDIPAGCCLSLIYEYNVAAADTGFYNDQDVNINGAGGQIYYDFDGASTSAEDVRVLDSINCISNVVSFTKTVDRTSSCEEEFLTYTFTIDNTTNIPLQNISFVDILPNPAIWASEPYFLNGLSIGSTAITGSNNGSFTIANIPAESIATFQIDAYIGNYVTNGTLSNTASLDNFPNFVNGNNGAVIAASSPTVNIYTLPEINAVNLVEIFSDEIADLSVITNGVNVNWVTADNGVITNPNNSTTTYTPSIEDIERGYATFTVTAESLLSQCGEATDTVRVKITKAYDFGDAPDTYSTLIGSSGPQHYLLFSSMDSLYLGDSIPDNELDGIPVLAGQIANGDDTNDRDDEDGILVFPYLANNSTGNYSIQVKTTNWLDKVAYLNTWIDFNLNGTFEASEGVENTIAANSGIQTVNVVFNIPTDIVGGLSYCRTRITTDTLLDLSVSALIDEKSIGEASNGEVEDYEIQIFAFEICDNGIDDDGDGLIDTADADCQECTALFVSSNVCLGDSILFDASNSSPSDSATLINYSWNFNNGSIAFGDSINYLFPDTGTYNVSLVVTDDSSCMDTIVNIVSVFPIYNTTFNDTICSGDTLIFGTQSLTTDGSYSVTFITSNGCDSIVNLILEVSPVSEDSITQTFCQGDTVIFGAQTLTLGGDYTEIFQAQNSCDSVVVLSLTEYPSYNQISNDSICAGDTVLFGTQILTTSGSYSDTSNSINGCDSLFTLNLFVSPVYSDSITGSFCQGDTFIFGSQELTMPGMFLDTLQSISACDSIIVLTLSERAVYSSSIHDTICAGDSLSFGSQVLTSSGSYSELFASIYGCDSTVNLTLEVLPVFQDSITQTFCQGDTFIFGAQELTVGGIYSSLFQAQNGCDSTFVLTLIENLSYSDTINNSICDGDTFVFSNQNLTASGTYTLNLSTVNTCDSLYTLNLTVNPVSNDSLASSFCQGDTIQFGSQQLTAAGTFIETFQSVGGCDSIVTLSLMLSPPIFDTIFDTICLGETYTYDNLILDTTGTYNQNLISSGGCDSIITLFLEVSNPLNYIEYPDTNFCLLENRVVDISGYNASSYVWNTGEIGPFIIIEEAGQYIVSFDQSNGCILNDTINVSIEDCIANCVVLAPTGFSPNASGVNDIFRVITTCEEGFSFFEYKIYNRWGELVFKTTDAASGWDGLYKGNKAPVGIYVYTIEYTKNGKSEMEFLKGNVTLIR